MKKVSVDAFFLLTIKLFEGSGCFCCKHLCSCSRGVLPRFTLCLRIWSFQKLSSGGIPAPFAFSRKKHAGAAVSLTAKPLKRHGYFNRIAPCKRTPLNAYIFVIKTPSIPHFFSVLPQFETLNLGF